MDAEELKKMLGLVPLPGEGGYYAETYRAADLLPAGCLSARYSSERSAGTAIYFLLTPDTFSAMHRLQSDEVYHFYLGDPVELLLLHPGGLGEVQILGADLGAGMQPQLVVPRGTWQGSRVLGNGTFSLMGTTMAPGFAFEDFELGDRNALLRLYPRYAEMIRALTR